MNQLRKLIPLLFLFAFSTVSAQPAAQNDTCGAMVQQAMREVQSGCAETGRNQACYGYVSLQATARDGVTDFQFTQRGDLANVADLSSVQLEPLNTAADTWGILMMKLQANLPETLPGQNVTFLLFGDVEIHNAADPETHPTLQPMQAFYFSTGITQTDCQSAPADGILIQTPQGGGKIHLRANGVDMQLGSTAFLRAQPSGIIRVSLLEGRGIVRSGGRTVVVPSGAEVGIPLDENLEADGEPGEPYAYDLDEFHDLPLDVLPEEFEIDDPASDEELDDAYFESEDLDLLDDEFDDEHEGEDDADFEDDSALEDDAAHHDSGSDDDGGGDFSDDSGGGSEGDGGE
jgi:hypothetical protein